MPTQENSEGLPSVNEPEAAAASDTLASEAQAIEKPSSSGMPTHSEDGMTKAEALAIAWTGIEALAQMKQAVLFRSRRSGRVRVELLGVDLTDKGLVER